MNLRPSPMMAAIIDLTEQSLSDQKSDRSFVNMTATWLLTDAEWHPLTEAFVLSQGPYVPLTQGKASGISVMVKSRPQHNYARSYDVWVRYHVDARTANYQFDCGGNELRARIEAALPKILEFASRTFPNATLFKPT